MSHEQCRKSVNWIQQSTVNAKLVKLSLKPSRFSATVTLIKWPTRMECGAGARAGHSRERFDQRQWPGEESLYVSVRVYSRRVIPIRTNTVHLVHCLQFSAFLFFLLRSYKLYEVIANSLNAHEYGITYYGVAYIHSTKKELQKSFIKRNGMGKPTRFILDFEEW